MRSNRNRAIAGLALVALAVVAFVVLKEGSSDSSDGGGSETTPRKVSEGKAAPKDDGAREGEAPSTAKPKQDEKKPAQELPTIKVRDDEPVGGVVDLTYDAGDRIRFRVNSDVADEVHLHGYDISREVAAGGTTTFDFVADIEGIFEVELEERAVPIAELTVNP